MWLCSHQKKSSSIQWLKHVKHTTSESYLFMVWWLNHQPIDTKQSLQAAQKIGTLGISEAWKLRYIQCRKPNVGHKQEPFGDGRVQLITSCLLHTGILRVTESIYRCIYSCKHSVSGQDAVRVHFLVLVEHDIDYKCRHITMFASLEEFSVVLSNVLPQYSQSYCTIHRDARSSTESCVVFNRNICVIRQLSLHFLQRKLYLLKACCSCLDV